MGAGVVKNDEKTAIKDSGMREILKKATKDYRGWTPLLYGLLSGFTCFVGKIAWDLPNGLLRYVVNDLPRIPQYVMEHPDVMYLLGKSFEQVYSAFSRVNSEVQMNALYGFVGGVILVGQTKKFLRKRIGGEKDGEV